MKATRIALYVKKKKEEKSENILQANFFLSAIEHRTMEVVVRNFKFPGTIELRVDCPIKNNNNKTKQNKTKQNQPNKNNHMIMVEFNRVTKPP